MQDYNELENQIGDMGGDSNPQESSTRLGKLKHKSSYGKKEDLNEDEQKSMEKFLAKGKKLEEQESISIADGWIPINREEMGLRSLFYPKSWEFYIRPATVNAIKNWTAVDEERADEVNKVFNEIIKSCVKIETHDINPGHWDQINSWDRFWFILKIREYTFSSNQNTVEFTDVCSECGDEITYKLTSDGLFYDFPDEDLIDKYWTGNAWEIDPREYNVDHEPITLYTPKISKDNAIIEWASAKYQAKQKIDETFITYLTWLLNKPNKDAQLLDRQIHKIYDDYKHWSLDMFNFITDVINNININPSEKLKVICPHCSREAISTVQFPNGIKSLFATKSNVKKFGSR